jgi:hypothetical protein
MSSFTTITTNPDLSSLGSHLATHILSQLRISPGLATRITTKKALFTKADFKAASKDRLHRLRDQAELVITTTHPCTNLSAKPSRRHGTCAAANSLASAYFPLGCTSSRVQR